MIEWLIKLEQHGAYEQLLSDAGCLELAAWRLAQAKCIAHSRGRIPTRMELHVAAREIVERSGLTTTVPKARALADICESAGLPVI